MARITGRAAIYEPTYASINRKPPHSRERIKDNEGTREDTTNRDDLKSSRLALDQYLL
jgi:hypothetical protein